MQRKNKKTVSSEAVFRFVKFLLNLRIQGIVGFDHYLTMITSFFSVFFVFLEKVREGIKNPGAFDFKGSGEVWVERFELSAS